MRAALVFLTVFVMVVSAMAQTPQPITEWLICGPFPFARQVRQFFTDFLTEHGGEANIRPQEGMAHSVEGLGKVTWQRHRAPDGVLDFVALMAKMVGEERPRFWQLRYGLAYAYTEIRSDKPQQALLLIGSEDWCTVWLNGERIHENFVYRHLVRDKDAVLVRLRSGVNRLLIKVARIAGGWGTSARIVMPITHKLFVKAERHNPCPPDGNSFVPELREGETVPVWGYVTVVNASLQTLPFVQAQVRENEWFAETIEQIGSLASGESSQLPFLLVPKRSPQVGESPRVVLLVETVGEQQTVELPVTIRGCNEPFFTTHRSRLDGSVQPMTLLVPPDYDPQRAYPLVVALHGSKGCLIGHAFSVKDEFILVAPHGRGQTGYRDFGELDVFEAMAEVGRRYRIDRERVYLTGHSMGGGGTFRLATRYPHLWAAVAPMASAGTRPLSWLQNLLHVPTLFYHGSEDEVVPVTLARQAADYLRQLGYNFRYEEVAGKPHWWGVDFPEMFVFFQRHTLTRAPERIVFWSDDPRACRAYWVEATDLDNYAQPFRLTAQVTSDGSNKPRLVLDTENVREVVLHLSEAPARLQQLPFVVEWNKCQACVALRGEGATVGLRLNPPFVGVAITEATETMEQPLPSTRYLWLWHRDGQPVFTSEMTDAPVPFSIRLTGAELSETTTVDGFILPKTPQHGGPISAVLTHPFFVAYDERSEGAKRAARQFQHWWHNYALGVCQMLAFRSDRELVQLFQSAAKSQRNLVVFHKPSEGSRYGSLVLGADEVRIGEQRVTGKRLAVRTLFPNPYNPRCYILINASVTEQGLQVLAYVPMDFEANDYLVVSDRFLLEGPKGILARGRWNKKWQAGS